MDHALLSQTDETKEAKATLYLEGTQLALLKLENPQLGQHVPLVVDACITGINSHTDDEGRHHATMTFELHRVLREQPEADPMAQVAAMFPSMKKA